MIKDELESKDVTPHVMPEDLFKENKSLLFDTKDHDNSCSRWWRKGQTARPKVITLFLAQRSGIQIKKEPNEEDLDW